MLGIMRVAHMNIAHHTLIFRSIPIEFSIYLVIPFIKSHLVWGCYQLRNFKIHYHQKAYIMVESQAGFIILVFQMRKYPLI